MAEPQPNVSGGRLIYNHMERGKGREKRTELDIADGVGRGVDLDLELHDIYQAKLVMNKPTRSACRRTTTRQYA